MWIKKLGKKLGIRIYLRKNAVQIDIGRSKVKRYKVIQASFWDSDFEGFFFMEQYIKDGRPIVVTGCNKFKDGKAVDEEYFYCNKNLVGEPCHNTWACEYMKKRRSEDDKSHTRLDESQL